MQPEHPTSNALLSICLFGSFEARINGEPLPPLRSIKGKQLLALLALRAGQDVTRQWLAETLWPETDPASALVSLRQSLADLKRAFGEQAAHVQSPTKTTLRLDTEGVEIDVAVFGAAIKRGDAASLRQAAALYRGALLEGMAEAWIWGEREARQQSYVRALETLATHARVDGNTEEAIRCLRLAVVHDPCRESACRDLMYALAAFGEPQAAVEAYQSLRRSLHDDFNAPPSVETTTVYKRILEKDKSQGGKSSHHHQEDAPAGAFASLQAGAGNLPVPLTTLIGREDALHNLKTRVLTNALVTLVGTGGVGKTRLAIQAGNDLADSFADGVWFADLSGLTAGRVEGQLVSVFGIRAETEQAMFLTLCSALRSRQLLLILDNCETCLTACALVAQELLRACPHLRLLASSRQRLGLTSEQVETVKPLALESAATSLSPAAQLFFERAQSVCAAFALSPENVLTVEAICQHLDGLPLALELAAPLVDILTPQEILALLNRQNERFDLLTEAGGVRPDRHQSLRAVIASSVALLSPAERELLRRLGLFVGGCTLEAAEAVSVQGNGEKTRPEDEENLPAPTTLSILRTLVGKSLVIAEPSGIEMRYRMLESIREYAQGMLGETWNEARIRARHLNYFLELASRSAGELTGPEQSAWLARLEQESGNLRAALEWAAHNSEYRRRGLRLASHLGRYWQIRGHFAEGRAWLTRFLHAPEVQEDQEVRADALNWHALLSVFVGELAEAEQAARDGLAIWETLHNGKGAAGSRGILGIVAANRGEYAAAEQWYRQSLEGAKAAGDVAGEAGTLGYLGIVAANQGYYEQARECYEASLRIRRSLQDRWGIAAALNNLGLLARKTGDFDRARALLEDALTIRRELQDRRNMGISLNVLALIALHQGDVEAAARDLREATDLFEAIGDRRSLAYALEAWARLAAATGADAQAAQLHGASQALRMQLGSPLPLDELRNLKQGLHPAATELGEAGYEAAYKVGECFTLEHALLIAKRIAPIKASQTAIS